MSIDRQNLIEYLEYRADQLQYKIEQNKDVEEDISLMRIAKQIVINQLLEDLYKGHFDKKEPLSEP